MCQSVRDRGRLNTLLEKRIAGDGELVRGSAETPVRPARFCPLRRFDLPGQRAEVDTRVGTSRVGSP